MTSVAIAGREEILRVLLKAGIAAVLGTLALLLWFEGDRLVYWPYATLLASHFGASGSCARAACCPPW